MRSRIRRLHRALSGGSDVPDYYLGEIRLMGIAPQNIPAGWVPCDGQSLPVQEYQALYSLIGNIFGGDAKAFKLPDLRGRCIPGASERGENAFGAAVYPQGRPMGAESVTLTAEQVPGHTHLINVSCAANSAEAATTPSGNTLGVAQGVGTNQPFPIYAAMPAPEKAVALGAATISSANGNGAHENRQPTLALTYCIAVRGGSYPPRAE